MLRFLETIAFAFWDTIRRSVALILPFLDQARTLRGWGTGLRWVVRILLLIGLFVGLWWVNGYFELDKAVKSPTLRGIGLEKVWLPILGLLTIALLWVVWWVWMLLRPEEETVEFPDIETAWDEAVRAANEAGIDPTEVPLFLVLGQPVGGEEALFSATQLSLSVKGAPHRPEAPIHVWGNRDGLYVTCAGASLLGQQVANLSGVQSPALGSAAGAPPAPSGNGSALDDDPYKTLPPRGRLKDVQSVLARAREQGREPSQLTDGEKEEIRQLLAEDGHGAAHAARPRINLLKNGAQVAWMSARLKYLCRLIVRDRHPYCPINGTLLLIPYAGTDSEEDANQTGLICQQDLANARHVLQVHCPTLALVVDLETAPGFNEFVARFPPNERQRRLGQRFPLMPDLTAGESPAGTIDRGAQWTCTALLPTWIYKLFRVEIPGREELSAVVTGNMQLYHLLYNMRERRKRFGRIVSKAVVVDGEGPMLYGGCYVGGTGRDPSRQQAFVAGVFQRLLREQNYVSWTTDALKEEEEYARWTRYGYAGIVLGVVAVAVLGYFSWSASS